MSLYTLGGMTELNKLRSYMRLAVDLAKRSPIEPDKGTRTPKVGAVVVNADAILGKSYRGEFGEGKHAEFGLLEQLEDEDLHNAILLTTLEPCSRRNTPKRPCAERIVEAGFRTVYVGIYDPNPRIYREGWRTLRDGGVEIRDFPSDLRAEIREDNKAFLSQFREATGEHGVASFDYTLNGGKFTVSSGLVVFETGWTQRGADSIYAIDNRNHVALARYAKEFEEIDDPGALDFSNYNVGVKEGEIVVFRKEDSHLLVKVVKVHGGPDWGADRYELNVEYQARRATDTPQGEPA